MIKLNNVNKIFNRKKQNEVVALNNVSLDFPEKGLVVLFGHSGSGKTTLLNVVGGLDKPTNGNIVFNNHNFSKYDASKWDHLRNENIGYIFQNYFLQPNLTVFENVSFSLKLMGITDKEIIESRVRYVLKQVNMDVYRNKLAVHLSGGQQQRVAIARALVKNPKVIIADEPTGNLDSNNKIDVMNIIKKISEDSLVILVTHEPRIASFYGDRIIEIKDGNVVNDYINDDSSSSHFEEEREIYLTDFKNKEKFSAKSNDVNINYYSDDEHANKVDVKLVVRNNSLFIEVNSDLNQINLLMENSKIKLVDGSREVKSREELLTTTFDRELLNTDGVKRRKNSIISVSNSFFIALKRILNFGRRGKFAIFSFVISGAAFAFAMINIIGFVLMKPSDFVNVPTDYISYLATEDQLDLFTSEYGSNLVVLPYRETMLYFNYQSNIGSVNSASFNLSLAKIVNYNKQLADNEIVVSTGFYEKTVESNSRLDLLGIHKIEHLIGEEVQIGNNNYIIKDFVKNDKKVVYFKDVKQLAQLIDPFLTSQPGLGNDEYNKIIMSIVDSSINNTPLYRFYFVNGTKAERLNFINQNNNNLHKDNVKDVYDEGVLLLNSERTMVFASIITTSLVLFGISLVGFYFIMRSSMFNRIYQLGLYRVLGVRKHEIINSFIIEIVLLVTVSSLIGYLGLYLILNSLTSVIMLTSLVLGITFLGFVLGLIIMYLLFLLLGLLPVFSLLRLTPTEIITKYDI